MRENDWLGERDRNKDTKSDDTQVKPVWKPSEPGFPCKPLGCNNRD